MKLNLGAADWHIDGWKSIDLPAVDLGSTPWPWKTGSIQSIYAGHILEHFDRETGVRFLGECLRILKPGGVLFLAVPDMDKFIDCRLAGDPSPLNGYKWSDLNHFLGGDGTEPRAEWRHRYMYCWASLAWTLADAGFRECVRDLEYRPGLDNPAYAAISLYARAAK